MPAARWTLSPTAAASHSAIILHDVVPRMPQQAGLGTHGVGSVRDLHLHMTSRTAGNPSTPAYVNRSRPFRPPSKGALLAASSVF